jgi:hypothetical protein
MRVKPGRNAPRRPPSQKEYFPGLLGQPLDIPEPYHQDSWRLICKLVRDIGTEMAAKA